MPASAFPDDRALIAAFLQGDRVALQIVDRWIDAALCGLPALPTDTRDDLRQDVRMRLVKSLRRAEFRGASSLRTYIHHIAHNAGIDFRRRVLASSERFPRSDGRHREAQATSCESAAIAGDLVRRVLAELPEGDREMMWLLFGERCSYAEAARRLGSSVGAIKVRVHRCRRRIRKRLPDERESKQQAR